MAKTVISRNFRYPSAELRNRVRLAVRERGFRSEQAFLVAACERELRESDSAEATDRLEARIALRLPLRIGGSKYSRSSLWRTRSLPSPIPSCSTF